MWKKIMEIWYRLWGVERGSFGTYCPPPQPKKKRGRKKKQMAPDGKPVITRERFEKIENEVLKQIEEREKIDKNVRVFQSKTGRKIRSRKG